MSGTYRLRQPSHPVRVTGSDADGARRPAARLLSLDAFRGFIMILLAAEGFGISHFARLPEDAPVWQHADYATWQQIAEHFRHAPWVTFNTHYGVAVWDLIQPAFMFMVGVAMPFSFAKRQAMGDSGFRRLLHALIRSVVLVLLGVFLYSMNSERTNWIFPNVLAQIGLGYFFVYLLLNRSWQIQLTALLSILVGYWGLFWMNPPPKDYDFAAYHASVDEGQVFAGEQAGFAAWSKNGNVAFRFDQWLLPQLRSPEKAPQSPPETAEAAVNDIPADEPEAEDAHSTNQNHQMAGLSSVLRQWFFSNPKPYQFNKGGYTTLNFVPSIGTALLGVLCGQLLMSGQRPGRVLLTLLISGAVCVATGIAAHYTVCPIIKRIWTPSWVLFSGGCVIWMLMLFTLVFDLLPLGRLALPLRVVGMNSLAIYLMGSLIAGWTEEHVIGTHLSGVLEWLLGAENLADDMYGRLIGPIGVAVVFWLLAVWMYRQKLFVRV